MARANSFPLLYTKKCDPSMKQTISCYSIRILVAFMLMVSFTLPVVENLTATTDIDVGGTHYDAGQEWLGLYLSLTHTGSSGSAHGTADSRDPQENPFFDSCDGDVDGEWLPITQAHRVYFTSARLFFEKDSPRSPTLASSLYRPPRS